MARGRKAIAAEVKQSTGAFRVHPERKNKSAPVADGETPEMPDYFGEHERQKWAELCKDLKQNGVLSSDTREILIAYCTAFFHKQSAGWRTELGIELDGKIVREYPTPRVVQFA